MSGFQGGTIAKVLEKELWEELKRPSIVVWLDKDGHYTDFVDDLAERARRGTFEAPVVPFKGSYLEMMLAMEGMGDKLDPEPLLIYMPGHNEDSVRKTPMLEMYRAGRRFRKKLETLVQEASQGYVTLAEREAFLAQPGLSLSQAEAWLSAQIHGEDNQFLKGLEDTGLDGILDALFDEHFTMAQHINNDDELKALQNHLARHTGFDEHFIDFILSGKQIEGLIDLTDVYGGWLMAVEFVHDLRHTPTMPQLQPLKRIPKVALNRVREQVQRFRDRHPHRYETLSTTTEALLAPELGQVRAEDLGKIDTFRAEEAAILRSALSRLSLGSWSQPLSWATERHHSPSFWLQRDPERQFEWTLVQAIALLGVALDRHARPLERVRSHDEALEVYTEVAHKVDMAHRHLEQKRLKLLKPHLSHFADLLGAANRLRELYRRWADQLAMDFADICQREGFLPTPDQQQRNLFAQDIEPLIHKGHKVAVFALDGFRYEMAAELRAAFEGSGSTVHLKARMAELPTITAVGMNALAPVVRAGQLSIADPKPFGGFKTGEFTVKRPEDRVRAMAEKALGTQARAQKVAQSSTLTDLCERPMETLRRGPGAKNVRLLVVHVRELDEAGEHGQGLASFEVWLGQIVAAWRRLRELGYNAFVLSADHGFLLQDETTGELPYGLMGSTKPRYAVGSFPEAVEGTISASLSALGYEGHEGHLIMPRDTRVFSSAKGGHARYVHGGNSLQERVIPVLSITHKSVRLSQIDQHEILAEALTGTTGSSRLRLKVRPVTNTQRQLGFTGRQTFEVALRTPKDPEVQVTMEAIQGGRATLTNQVITLEVEADWAELTFTLSGAQDGSAQVEVAEVHGSAKVTPRFLAQQYFPVRGRRPGDDTRAATDGDWRQHFKDTRIAEVFRHIEQHGSLTEAELIHKLGSARKARRFDLNFEAHLALVPFNVRIEAVASGKRYVLEK